MSGKYLEIWNNAVSGKHLAIEVSDNNQVLLDAFMENAMSLQYDETAIMTGIGWFATPPIHVYKEVSYTVPYKSNRISFGYVDNNFSDIECYNVFSNQDAGNFAISFDYSAKSTNPNSVLQLVVAVFNKESLFSGEPQGVIIEQGVITAGSRSYSKTFTVTDEQIPDKMNMITFGIAQDMTGGSSNAGQLNMELSNVRLVRGMTALPFELSEMGVQAPNATWKDYCITSALNIEQNDRSYVVPMTGTNSNAQLTVIQKAVSIGDMTIGETFCIHQTT